MNATRVRGTGCRAVTVHTHPGRRARCSAQAAARPRRTWADGSTLYTFSSETGPDVEEAQPFALSNAPASPPLDLAFAVSAPEAGAPGASVPVETAASRQASDNAWSPLPDARAVLLVSSPLDNLDFIASQRSGVSDPLFRGSALGVDSDVAGGGGALAAVFDDSPPSDEDRAGLYVPPRLLDALSLFLAKHYCAALPVCAPPLLLVWGPSGGGKSATLRAALAVLGVAPVSLAAEQLEAEEAGLPARRLAAAHAAAQARTRSSGVPSCLLLDDIDLGLGAFGHTDRTVNTQVATAALMALCDAGASVAAAHGRPCAPVVATASLPAALYAPLLRDGRAQLLFWRPTPGEAVRMVAAACGLDEGAGDDDTGVGGLGGGAAARLVAAFPGQPVAFFGALPARAWGAALGRWVGAAGGAAAAAAALLPPPPRQQPGAGAPASSSPPPPPPPAAPTLAELVAAGEEALAESRARGAVKLSAEYFPLFGLDGDGSLSQQLRKGRRARADHAAASAAAAPPPVAPGGAAVEAARAAARAALAPGLAAAAAAREASDAAAAAAAAASPAAEEAASAAALWPTLTVAQAAALLQPATDGSGLPAGAEQHRRLVLVDVRPAREVERTATIAGALRVPCAALDGPSLAPAVSALPGFVAALADAAVRQPTRPQPPLLLLLGPAPGAPAEAAAREGMAAACAAGVTFAELAGGADAWRLVYTPTGVRRQRGSYSDGTGVSFWTASN